MLKKIFDIKDKQNNDDVLLSDTALRYYSDGSRELVKSQPKFICKKLLPWTYHGYNYPSGNLISLHKARKLFPDDAFLELLYKKYPRLDKNSVYGLMILLMRSDLPRFP